MDKEGKNNEIKDEAMDEIKGGIFLAVQKSGKPLLSILGELTLLELAGLRSYLDAYVETLVYRSVEQSLKEEPVDLRKKDSD